MLTLLGRRFGTNTCMCWSRCDGSVWVCMGVLQVAPVDWIPGPFVAGCHLCTGCCASWYAESALA